MEIFSSTKEKGSSKFDRLTVKAICSCPFRIFAQAAAPLSMKKYAINSPKHRFGALSFLRDFNIELKRLMRDF